MAVTITQEDVKNAKSYMPLEYKQALSQLMATLCVRTVKNSASTEENPLPNVRGEDRMMRQQCLMGVLAGFYFGQKFEMQTLEFAGEDGKRGIRPVNYCMSVEALNDFCESHPINQLERMKREKAVANKVYDLLYDFKGFEAFLNGAIRETIEMQNDPALRIAQMMAIQTTPETIKEAMEAIKEYREQTEEAENA